MTEDEGVSACPARLPVRRVLGELVPAVLVAALTSLALQYPIARFGLSEPTELPEVAASASATGLLAVLFAAVVLIRKGFVTVKLVGVWVALSALATSVLAWPLEPTKLYYGGISVDQMFRLQYLTRLTDSPVLADMNYQGLPPYYPAGWFWLGGRFADFAGLPAWLAYKPYALLTIAVTSAVAFTLWSAVVRRRIAVLLAVSTTLSGFLHGMDEPYAWLSAALLPPVAVAGWHTLSCRTRGHRRALIGIGLFLGLAAITYTLNLAFATMTLVAMAVIGGASRIRAGAGWRAVTRSLLARLLLTGGVAGAVALLVWAPYLVAKLGGAPTAGAANRYLPLESMPPLPMFEPTAFGALCLVGLCWLVLAVQRSEVAQGLLILTGVVYLWFALSTLAIAAQTTLLAFRVTTMLEVTLAAAGVLGLLDVWERARTRADPRFLVRATALACVLGIGGAAATTQTALITHIKEAAQPAYVDYYPTGQNSQRQTDPAIPGAWNDELLTTLDELTGREPSDVGLLTAYYPILSFAPYWGFQQETAHYANPLSSFDARAAEVQRWASAASPAELLDMLNHSPFTAPDAFLLRRAPDGLHVTLSHDAFPHQPNVQTYDVRFDESVFEPFVRRDVGPFVVIALP